MLCMLKLNVFKRCRQQLQEKEVQKVQLSQQLRRSQRTVNRLLRAGGHVTVGDAQSQDSESIATGATVRDDGVVDSRMQVKNEICA